MTWVRRTAALALALCAAEPALATSAPRRRPAVREAASLSRPDRALYQEAQKAEAGLKRDRKLLGRRTEWERVLQKYRRIVARYPQSPYCDNALLQIGTLYQEMARRFATPRYEDEAVAAYGTLAEEYPSSSLAEQALWNVVASARQGNEPKRVGEAARDYLEAFPDSRRAPEVKALIKRRAPVQAAALPKPPPPGLAQVFKLRFWSGEASTRVVLDLDREVPLHHERLGHPERLWIDLSGTRLHPGLGDRQFPVGDGLLEQIRVGQNKDDVVRVVLDFRSVKDYGVFYLSDPTRLVIDVQGAMRPLMAESRPAEPPPSRPASPAPAGSELARLPPSPAASLAPSATPLVVRTSPPPEPVPSPSTRPVQVAEAPPSPAPTPSPGPEALSQHRVAVSVPREPARPSPRPVRPGITVDSGAFETQTRTPATAPAPARAASAPPAELLSTPQPNRNGQISLARQLGLGARRIVLDAGHGGHDPGTIGHSGLQEKDLVLDVALRLERLLRSELRAEVVMTRATDVFIPLEERTAIANSKSADLFLSIHANSSPNRRARGIETYFLNFARDAHAEQVAARENAISAATLKDLQGLVKAITLNTKIAESRDFAASLQESLVGGLRPYDQSVTDRGVHTAPFYVLIGASMPSVLAEIAFVSNPEEERKLKKGDYRDRIAQSLLLGVTRYLEALNRTQLRQLTSTERRSAVVSKGRRR